MSLARYKSNLKAIERHALAESAHFKDWIIYPHNEDLDAWLEKNKPSRIDRDVDGVGAILIFSKNMDEDEETRSGDKPKLMMKWEDLKKAAGQPGSKVSIDYNSIKAMAQDCGFNGGKWVFHVDTGKAVDTAWRNICKQMIGNGALSNLTTSAKVSPFSRHISNLKHSLVVHNRDHNYDEACIIEQALRVCGITEDLQYKPDFYSELGIYANNVWNIRPTIYISQYNHYTKKSEIRLATNQYRPEQTKSENLFVGKWPAGH